jgi:hypothetical protein
LRQSKTKTRHKPSFNLKGKSMKTTFKTALISAAVSASLSYAAVAGAQEITGAGATFQAPV